MQIDPTQIPTREMYQWMVGLITPRPIAWVSTTDGVGNDNLAPYSFFNGVGAKPPLLMFCPANKRDGSPKDTLANIRASGQFAVNIVTEEVLQAMNISATEYGPDEDEFEMSGVGKIECEKISVPRVKESLVTFECELCQSLQLGFGPGGANLVIGKIVLVHADPNLVDSSGKLIEENLHSIGRMGGSSYTRTTDRINLPRK